MTPKTVSTPCSPRLVTVMVAALFMIWSSARRAEVDGHDLHDRPHAAERAPRRCQRRRRCSLTAACLESVQGRTHRETPLLQA